MRQRSPSSFILAGVLLGALATPTGAQDATAGPSRSLTPLSFPRWDAGGSLGFLGLSGTETRSSWADWETKAEFRFDVGYHWSTHLKTDVAVSTSNEWSDYDQVQITVPGVPVGYAYELFDRRLSSVSPAVTWQFRDNQFMHPYVSGGVRIGLLQEDVLRETGTYRSGGVSYTVTGFEESRTHILARPFVAGGFKSYITRRVFTRTEARLAFAQDGIRQVSVIAGIGVDF